MRKILLFSFTLLFLFPSIALAQRGCCSWHGGVSGCGSNGRTICSDGTYSPSCTCGGSYTYTAPVYLPTNPTAGIINFKGSSNNWCNHDVTIDWTGATYATGFSVGISKYAGADPGPLADTTSNSYTFTNITPGNWYINVKALNSGKTANQITYWTVMLPKTEPTLNAYLSGDSVTYNFECLTRVEAPDFVINSMKAQGNYPSGVVSLTSSTPQTLIFKGWDSKGKTYEKTLTYVPPVPTPEPVESISSDDREYLSLGLVGLGLGGTVIIWLLDKWSKRRQSDINDK
jgi:hypothetical protein